MSSAILYGAIVVIWAGVLIPRWLRRESSAETATVTDSPGDSPESPVASETTAPPRPERRPAPPPQHDEEHARVLRARRRLLGMLVALAVSAGALAVMGLAAWWVILPPSVMLVGYLALLREASRADAERRSPQRSGTAMRTSVVSDAGATAVVATAAVAPAPAPAPVVAAAAVVALAPDAEIIDITDRVNEEFYDQYADAKLRAVGD